MDDATERFRAAAADRPCCGAMDVPPAGMTIRRQHEQPDDGEPITPEFLRSCGWSAMTHGRSFEVERYPDETDTPCRVYFSFRAGGGCILSGHGPKCNIASGGPLTRGELRLMLRVMGVPASLGVVPCPN